MSPRSGQLHVHLQMISANVISEAKVPIAPQQSNNINMQQGELEVCCRKMTVFA